MRAVLLFCAVVLAVPASARDLVWQSLDSLLGGDRALAEQTLFEDFGDDPEQWPDWIDPEALYVPAGNDRLLIVRRPVHEPCGEYKFAVLSTITPALSRDKIGDFCAGELDVLAVPNRDWPDFYLTEGYQQDANGDWQRADLRLRWRDGQWWKMN